MIGKLKYYWRYVIHYYLMVLWYKIRPKKMVLSKRQFHNPTYPPDLAEVFDLNRTEDTTDRVLWRKLEPEDK